MPALDGGGVRKSDNGGAGWTAVNSGLTNTYIRVLAIDPKTPTTLYAGTYEGVFKSSNGGNSWNAVNTGLSNDICPGPGHRPENPDDSVCRH